MPLTNYKVIATAVGQESASKSGWKARATVLIDWDCVPPQDGDGDVDYEAEIRDWVHHWLSDRLP